MVYVKIINISGQLSDFTCIILALFALTAVIQLAYYLFVYLRVVLHDGKSISKENAAPPVSVIVCARNEEANLKLNLPSILEQDYPLYEVIVVNDCSEDNTEQLLADFKQKYTHLRSTFIKKDGTFRNGKKFATTMGVKAALHEWLLFTEANYRPENTQWVKSMSQCFSDTKSIVLGYGGYFAQKGFLNKWIRYDACFVALQYFGFAKMVKAYMGVGCNLAYRKSLFFANNGFAEHAHVLSNGDALLVNKAATRQNVAVTYVKDAHTRAAATRTFSDWLWQKRQSNVVSKYFRSGQLFWLTLEPFSRVLMWVSFGLLMFFCPFWQYILLVFAIRTILFMTVIGLASKRFNEPGILQHALFFDLVMPFVYFYVFLFNRIFSKHNKWK